jgi:pimeloyl-ACP methyl ester carboxylesterase
MRGARSCGGRYWRECALQGRRQKANRALSPIAIDVVCRIDALFEIERSVNGKRSVWMFGGAEPAQGGESHRFNMFPGLARIQCPTLILGGEDDPNHPIESQADIVAALPPRLVEFERFPKCGQAVIPDAPERAMAVIRDFIQH